MQLHSRTQCRLLLLLCLLLVSPCLLAEEPFTFPEDVGTFLKEFRGKADELDPYIRHLRIRKSQSPDDEQAVHYLTAFLLKKLLLLTDRPTSEIEYLFLEASDLQPDSPKIEKGWAQLILQR